MPKREEQSDSGQESVNRFKAYFGDQGAEEPQPKPRRTLDRVVDCIEAAADVLSPNRPFIETEPGHHNE
jgi:hypothetical protein